MAHVPRSLFNNKDDHQLAKKIVYKLGNNTHDNQDKASVDHIMGYLPNSSKRSRVERLLRTLIRSPQTPVKGNVSNDEIWLDDYWDDPIVRF